MKRPQIWVFGMYERPQTERAEERRRCIFIPVPKRDAFTLLNIIYKHIAPGTLILSDCWAAYNEISKLDKSFQHKTVNHSLNFVDPVTMAHTNGIESVWCSGKTQFKTMRGVSRKYLNSYLTEFMWRRSTTTARYDSCEAIIDAIAKEYPLDSIANVVDDLEKFDLGFEFEEESDEANLDVEDIGVNKIPLPLYVQDELDSSLDIIKNISQDLQIDSSISTSEISVGSSENSELNSNSNNLAKNYNFYKKNAKNHEVEDKQFKDKILVELEAFSKSDKMEYRFPATLNKNERYIIHLVAESLNLKHSSEGTSPERILVITKLGHIVGSSVERKTIRETLILNSQPEIPNHQHISDILNAESEKVKRTPKKRGRKPKGSQESMTSTANNVEAPKRELRSRTKKD